MSEGKQDEASEKTSLFHSGVRESWRMSGQEQPARVFTQVHHHHHHHHHHQQQQQQQQRECHCQQQEEGGGEQTRLAAAADSDREKNYSIPARNTDQVVLIWNSAYFRSFQGALRMLQVILSIILLVCLTTSGRKEGGYLSLPLCWHFRIMVFVLVLTLLSSVIIWTVQITGLANAFPINWYFMDMVVYSVFAFLYLVGASLVASAFDFYEKMLADISHQTIQQLILCVILGYICMFVYGTTAIIGYRQWRIQLNQYQRRKLLEEDDFEI